MKPETIVWLVVTVVVLAPVAAYFILLPALPSRIRTPVQRWFCRIGWHESPYQVIPAPADLPFQMVPYYNWQPKQMCPCCGYVGTVDSQGNLF